MMPAVPAIIRVMPSMLGKVPQQYETFSLAQFRSEFDKRRFELSLPLRPKQGSTSAKDSQAGTHGAFDSKELQLQPPTRIRQEHRST